MPLIMLDGVDGAGKTTMANELAELWHKRTGRTAEIIHRTQDFSTDGVFDEYENSILDYSPGSGRLLILDRWHISEVVYGGLLRGRSRITRPGVHHVNKFLESRGCLNVIMTAPASVIHERLQARGEDYLPLKMIVPVMKAYHAWAHEFDWVLARPGAVTAAMILDAAEAQDTTMDLMAYPRSYLGGTAPTSLACVFRDPEAPVVPLQESSVTASSVQLPEGMALVYANDVSPGLVHRLGAPKLYAVSDEASQVLSDNGLGYVDVF